jgi:phage shock protein E
MFITVLSVIALLFADPLPAGYWIDVRTPEEYAKGHVRGAANIPFHEIGERIGKVTTDKDAAIHVYCEVGGRSEVARLLLVQAGYKNVKNQGAYEDWKD